MRTVKTENMTYAGWPLQIIEYRTSKSVQAATKWKPGAKPGAGEAPIEFLGLNILVRWGPIGTNKPTSTLDAGQLAAAIALRDALDPAASAQPTTAPTAPP